MPQTRKELINQSIDYILENLDGPLTVKCVAEQFHYSEFHFGRVFKAETGESLYAFIKRLKLDQSAIDLKIKQDKSITEIGLDYGYTPSNYSSAFKKHTSLSPVQFRRLSHLKQIADPFHPEKTDVFAAYDAYHAKIKLEELPDVPVLYERTMGPYSNIKENWRRILNDRKEYLHPGTQMIERFYDDPSIAAPGSCICDLCLSVEGTCERENVTTIRGGRFAVYRYEGAVADIFCAVQGVFRSWLPKSHHRMSERYGLHIYRTIDWAHDFVVMDLCIPIE